MAEHILFIAGNARSLVANRGDLIRAMISLGHVVSAAVPEEDYLNSVESLDIPIYRFKLGRAGLNPLRDIRTIRTLIDIIRRSGATMTMAYTIKPVVYGSLAARLVGLKGRFSMITGLGSTFADHTSLKEQAIRWLVVRLYRLGAACSHKVFFQNPDDLKDFLRLKIMDDNFKAVRTMGSGVNLDRFPRKSLSQERPIIFLLIARLLKDKGVTEFVAAAELLHDRYPYAKFVVVGPHDPALRHSLPSTDLAAWKCLGGIEFIGGVSDVSSWLERCSVFVLPSYYREGTPRSVLEAMATGRAIITTDSPGCRETVTDGENGFLVPPRDQLSLAHAMERFLLEPQLVSKMAEASYLKATNEYDVKLVNRVILNAMGLT